jgi:hypothetical protein
MSDLSLNFDTGNKNVPLSNSTGNSSINLRHDDNINLLSPNSDTSPKKVVMGGVPNLSVSDPVGMSILANTPQPVLDRKSDVLSPKSGKSDEFSFFKTEDKGGIVDGDLPKTDFGKEDSIFMNSETKEIPGYKPIHRLSPQEIKNEKIDLIYKFKKLEQQGVRTTINYNMNSNLDDMRNEYFKLKKQRENDNAVKFQRKMLMAAVTGLEFMNTRFDPFSVKLDGWSESVNENLNDYDEIFEELAEKYGGDSDVAPEIKLMFTLAGSAFMFHLTNTMFKSSIPGMDDILQQNPELMKQFAEAAVGSINKTPSAPNPLASMMGFASNNSVPQSRNDGGSVPIRTTSPARSDMSGPNVDGLDDLISKMNLEPNKIPDLDNISVISGDSDKKSSITLNL